MKTKLLKKIRKRFEILYYPNRNNIYKYEIIDNVKGGTFNDPFVRMRISRTHQTKQECLDIIMDIVRRHYKTLSRKYKQSIVHTKVWHK